MRPRCSTSSLEVVVLLPLRKQEVLSLRSHKELGGQAVSRPPMERARAGSGHHAPGGLGDDLHITQVPVFCSQNSQGQHEPSKKHVNRSTFILTGGQNKNL